MNTLYLFRPGKLPGTRQRWKFVVDDKQTILSEELMPEDTPNMETTATVDARGHRVVTNISADDRRILSFFSPATPCWFPACVELREKYTAEIAALTAGCPECQKGAIIRKYQELVKKHESTTQSDSSAAPANDPRT